MQEYRVVLYHKQATSARTLFLDFAHGSVIGPQALPFLSSVMALEEESEPDLLPHPAMLHRQLAEALALDGDLFQLDVEFRSVVDTPTGSVDVYLAHFTTMDPPRALMDERGCRFYSLTELRGRHPAEMELLRRAYSSILGG